MKSQMGHNSGHLCIRVMLDFSDEDQKQELGSLDEMKKAHNYKT